MDGFYNKKVEKIGERAKWGLKVKSLNMPKLSERKKLLTSIDRLIYYSALYDDDGDNNEDIEKLLQLRFGVESYRFLSPSTPIEKTSSLVELLWILPDNEFKQELRMEKNTFFHLKSLIEDMSVFKNNSNNKQADVVIQLAVALERLGTYGNGSSIGKVARAKGIGNGTVVLYTHRVISAINELTNDFIQWPTPLKRKAIY